MSLEINAYEQCLLLAKAILFGGAMGVFYDLFRFLRIMKKFGKYFIAVQDIIFWVVSAFAVFAFMMICCDGVVRIYLVMGMLFGALCYYFSLGRITVYLFRFTKRIVDRLGKWFKRHIFSHIKSLFLKMHSSFKKIYKKIFNNCKKDLQKGINL